MKFVPLFVLAIFFVNGIALSEEDTKTILINADVSTRDSTTSIVALEGHVQIIYGDQHLSAQNAFVNFQSRVINASGQVTITNSKITIGGDQAIIEIDTNTGIIYNGYIQTASVLFEGETLFKLSNTEFLADGAKYSACTNCPHTWSFTGSKIKAQLGGYAYIKNAILRIGDVPIVPLPYLIVPLKSDRQSGLLIPEIGHSETGGTDIASSFFWAINRSQDATITFKNYEFRGIKTLLNYRYALTENSWGSLDANFLADKAFAKDPRLQAFRLDKTETPVIHRWLLKYDHYQDLPYGLVHRASFNNSGDLQYPKDFPLETLNNGDPSTENRMSLSQTTDNFFWMIDSSYYINLLQSNPLAGNDDAVHRLPEIRIARGLSHLGETDLIYTWDIDYTNLSRTSNYGFDTLNQPYQKGGGERYIRAADNTGATGVCGTIQWESYPFCHPLRGTVFTPGKDLLRTGQRLDAQTSLQGPFFLGQVDIIPKLSLRETDYSFTTNSDPTAVRRYIRTEVTSRTVFNKVYSIETPEKIKHEIQPEVTFSNIPWIYQPDHPFFGATARTSPFSIQDNVSDKNLNSPYGLQFDYFDRTYDMDKLAVVLTNRLIRKFYEDGRPGYKQFLNWKLAQSYDFYQAAGHPPYQPYSDVISELFFELARYSVFSRIDYFPYQGVSNSSSNFRFTNEIGDFYQLGYDLSYSVVPGQEVDQSSRAEQISLATKKSFQFVDVLGKIVFDRNPPTASPNQLINSYGLGAQFRLPGDCWYIKLLYYRPTGGSDIYSLALDFSFDGQRRSGLSEHLLDTFRF